MQYINYIAKALTAMGVAFLAGVAQYNLDLNPFVLVTVMALLAGIAVFTVPNGSNPTQE